MSNLKIHLFYALSIVVIGAAALLYLNHGSNNAVSSSVPPATTLPPANAPDATADGYKLTCQAGYNMIKPILSVNQEHEFNGFSPLKAKIMNVVEDNKRTGLLSSASVYLFNFSDGKWLSVNPAEAYNPGSLIKLPLLISLLKESETDPAVLSKKITFNDQAAIPTQTFNSNAIKKGNSYSVKELMHYMIAYSDNNATKLLNNTVVVKDFVKTFTDLNLPEPNVKDANYQITAKNYSDFFIALYYATYLSKNSSESAMELLSQCDFKDGFVKELPSAIKVAHKFGEWGDNRMGIHEMHESGVVYLSNRPYLLTVMTKGNNSKDLATVVSKISKLVFDEFSPEGSVAQN